MSNKDMEVFKKLDTYQSPTDLDKLWAQMEPALPKAPASRRFQLTWWRFALLGTTIFGVGYGIWLRSEAKPNTPSIASSSRVTQRDSHETDDQHNTQSIVSKELTQLGKTGVEGTQGIDEHFAARQNLGATASQAHTRNPFRLQTNTPPAMDPAAHTVYAHQVGTEAISNTNTFSSEAQTTLLTTSIQTIADKEARVDAPQNAAPAAMSVLSRLPYAMSQLQYVRQYAIGKRPDPTKDCYDWSGRRGRLRPYVGVYGGAHLPMRKIQARSKEFEQWAAVRNNTEAGLEAVNTGAFVGVQSRIGIGIDMGIDWLRINERFKATDTQKDTIGQTVVTSYIVNAPGDTTFFSETVPIVRTTETTRKVYNKYDFYTVPVAVSYTLGKGKLKPYVKAGAQISIMTKQRVGMLDNTYTFQYYDSGNTISPSFPFKAKVSAVPFVQLGARYPLWGPLEAFGEVRYLHMLRDITRENIGVAQRYKTVGAQVGLRLGL